MSMTREQAKAAIQMTITLGETIRDLGSVPSGHLYAHVMGVVSLEVYESMIDALVNA